jgi:hypothetical protein
MTSAAVAAIQHLIFIAHPPEKLEHRRVNDSSVQRQKQYMSFLLNHLIIGSK